MTFPFNDPGFDDPGAEASAQELQVFLRRHCPPAPPGDSSLEERLMLAIQTSTQSAALKELASANRAFSLHHRRPLWLAPPAIAASLVLGWFGYQTLFPPQPTAAQIANIESFMTASWTGTIAPADTAEDLAFASLTAE